MALSDSYDHFAGRCTLVARPIGLEFAHIGAVIPPYLAWRRIWTVDPCRPALDRDAVADASRSAKGAVLTPPCEAPNGTVGADGVAHLRPKPRCVCADMDAAMVHAHRAPEAMVNLVGAETRSRQEHTWGAQASNSST